MIESEEIKERRRKIIQSVRECFQNKLGKYTHQRISDEWFFYGLGFTREEMQYVFGFNAGFFKTEEIEGHTYSHIGVNVLVRTNGINPELKGLNSLQIFDKALDICESNDLKVMIDIHSAETDLAGHTYPLWHTPKIDEHQYKQALSWLSSRYKTSDTVIAYDLKNEPHGKAEEPLHAIWNDSDSMNNWKRFAEEAANAVLDKDPYALIVIEGVQVYPKNISGNNYTSDTEDDYHNTWWGGNLMGVRHHPIDLGSPERNRQIVYSVHEYGPSVFMQPWFDKDYSYETLYKDAWHDLWLYIAEEDIAPVFIGEWGGFMDEQTLKWLKLSRRLIQDHGLSFAVWCLNPESPDTGGLLKDDFRTWDEEKYSFVKEMLDL